MSDIKGYLDLTSDVDLAREVGFYVMAKARRVGEGALSHEEKVIEWLTELEAEVNNGGFDQYYFNSAGDHAAQLVTALEELRAPATAGLVTQANAQFGPAGPPADRTARQMQLLAVTEQGEIDLWDEHDRRFYAYQENLSTLAAAYIRTYRHAFTE